MIPLSCFCVSFIRNEHECLRYCIFCLISLFFLSYFFFWGASCWTTILTFLRWVRLILLKHDLCELNIWVDIFYNIFTEVKVSVNQDNLIDFVAPAVTCLIPLKTWHAVTITPYHGLFQFMYCSKWLKLPLIGKNNAVNIILPEINKTWFQPYKIIDTYYWPTKTNFFFPSFCLIGWLYGKPSFSVLNLGLAS